jgi:outer membrane protein
MAGRMITSLFLVLLGLAGCNSFDAYAVRREHVEIYRRTISEKTEKILSDSNNLSLDDCIHVALARNFNIRLANEALVQAEADIVQARAAMLPFIGAEASYSRLDEELGFGPMTFMDRDIYKAGLVVRQPIFTGGRLDAARKAARYSRDARVQDKRSVERDITFQVTRIYRTIQVAEAFQEVATEAVTLLETHEHDAGILVREGAVPELDLLRTRTELANARKELNAADNALDLALSALKNLLVIDLGIPVYLTEHLGRPLRPTDDLNTLTAMAISHRSELSSLKSQVAAAEQGFKAAKGEYLPAIALEGRHEYMEGDYRDIDGGEHWTVGIGAQLPIWNWDQTSAKVTKAKSQPGKSQISSGGRHQHGCLGCSDGLEPG